MKSTSYNFPSRRSVVMANHGLVATSQPLAAQAGLRILLAGGNAVDAAVATAAVLNVVEPLSTGMGGDLFALTYIAKTGRLTALNGSGCAPAAISIEALRKLGKTAVPERGPLSITVPGTVHAWETLLEAHGTLPLAEVLKPAIEYAEQGFPVSEIIAAGWSELKGIVQGTAYALNGRAPRAGEIFRNPELARTLRLLAEGGSEAFYRGSLAETIGQYVQSLGGFLNTDDLARHTSTWDEPISTEYHGVQVFECPPNGQGLVALLALNILEGFDLPSLEYGSTAYYHHILEALKLAFADGFAHIADPRQAMVPIETMLAKSYAATRRSLITERALVHNVSGIPRGDTVYLTVIDQDRNACSLINSIYYGFGSGVIVPGTGLMLQNRGASFSLDEAHPNALAPGKRPYHTIIPAMAFKGGKLWSSFGVMGGHIQPQGHVQVLLNAVDFGMNPQQALDAPRVVWHFANSSSVEAGIDAPALAARGHHIIPTQSFGGGQMIEIDEDSGALSGGSDPRKDGCAIGY